jgi:hypothetical protein
VFCQSPAYPVPFFSSADWRDSPLRDHVLKQECLPCLTAAPFTGTRTQRWRFLHVLKRSYWIMRAVNFASRKKRVSCGLVSLQTLRLVKRSHLQSQDATPFSNWCQSLNIRQKNHRLREKLRENKAQSLMHPAMNSRNS